MRLRPENIMFNLDLQLAPWRSAICLCAKLRGTLSQDGEAHRLRYLFEASVRPCAEERVVDGSAARRGAALRSGVDAPNTQELPLRWDVRSPSPVALQSGRPRPGYIAPEALQGQMSPQSDLWSVRWPWRELDLERVLVGS